MKDIALFLAPIILFLSLPTATVKAETFDGTRLAKLCDLYVNEKEDSGGYGRSCPIFIFGVIGGHDMFYAHAFVKEGIDRMYICLPDSVTEGQVARVVYNYLNDHPERWHKHADSLVFESLMEAFPCK